MDFSFWLNNKEFNVSLIEEAKNQIKVSIGEERYHVGIEFLKTDEVLLNINGKVYHAVIESNSYSCSVFVNGKSFRIEKKSSLRILNERGTKSCQRTIKTSMPGRVIKILMNEGEEVVEGQTILILEAMKMLNEVKSPQSGIITKIFPKTGDSVQTDAMLFSLG
ncbi:biotin/lipoyl-containing protein [Acidobacteriota bacterium]